MNNHYTSERNFQMLIALMRAHGVRKVICDPGTTNISLVASLQSDSYFELYSAVDERSAAYMACGMAAESGEPVAITCTGATASRDYMPGLTEAYYRKLPVLAITAMQHPGRIGQLVPQVIDRSEPPRDVCRLSVTVPFPSCAEDEAMCNRRINEALLELTRDGGGPVHVNIETRYPTDFSVRELPPARVIERYVLGDGLPAVPEGRVAVFVGAHRPFDVGETAAVEAFCDAYGAVVLCDQTSNYRGAHRVLAPLVSKQDLAHPACCRLDLIVHIGEVSGAYMDVSAGRVWRVSEDGGIRDAFGTLTDVFEMRERDFFEVYIADVPTERGRGDGLMGEWREADAEARSRIPELPFSNLWMASRVAPELPEGCALHLGILNTLRSWNFFETPESVTCWSNTGGFGIDGGLSTALGAALASPGRLVICAIGDLAFFYDMNAMGNRHLPANLRVLLINNGVGAEFRNYSHLAAMFGDDADAYIAAAGHFGSRSPDLVRHYATDLGCEYLAVTDKTSFEAALPRLVDPEPHDAPLVLEAFTDSADESDALRLMSGLLADPKGMAKGAVKRVLGDRGLRAVKSVLGR
ncbi:thiamine pyrophosphate-binding protein [Thermophilibacter sp.]